MATEVKENTGGVEDLTGCKFGHLTVLRSTGRTQKGGGDIWLCVCDCDPGREVELPINRLKYQGVVSCGCRKSEPPLRRVANRAWYNMNHRCYDPTDDSYPQYGGKGITVCERWRWKKDPDDGFENFLADMGLPPSRDRCSPDREQGAMEYGPSTVSWKSKTEQVRNRHNNTYVQFRGEERRLFELLDEWKLRFDIYANRRKRGLTVEEAITTPVKHRVRKITDRQRQIVRMLVDGYSYATIRTTVGLTREQSASWFGRVKQGLQFRDAVVELAQGRDTTPEALLKIMNERVD